MTHHVGIILNGVTGRMGTNQHLERSLCSIIKDGGILLESGERIMPNIILTGRSNEKLKKLAEEHGPSTIGKPFPYTCLLYTSPSPRDRQKSRMPSSA